MTHHASLHADKSITLRSRPGRRIARRCCRQHPFLLCNSHRIEDGAAPGPLYERLMRETRGERRVQKSLCAVSLAVNAVVKQ